MERCLASLVLLRGERESNRAPHSGVTNRIGGNLYVQHHFYIGVARPILPATDLYVGQDNGLAGVQGLSNALLISLLPDQSLLC